ncbi:maltose O-acetyltransferase [Enterococcus sp. AZ194]|uniref:sugar O-acetyltransferase n=1 Tax=Enterococcus sp. AZ194 TaxID=2774629 RepID=UPI003F2196B3
MQIKKRIERGAPYLESCQSPSRERLLAEHRMREFNQTKPDEIVLRFCLFKEIFGVQKKVRIEPPFFFSYGRNIQIGDHCLIHSNCTFLDEGKISIGENVLFGTGVTILTSEQSINPNDGEFMYTKAVTIKNNCVIGANVTIYPGVTIGENAVVKAESVVSESLPDNCVAKGNPCKVEQKMNDQD